MSGKKSKEIRKLFLLNEQAISKRNYRRFKNEYARVPSNARRDFIEAARELFGQA
jgi:hypothetical protein